MRVLVVAAWDPRRVTNGACLVLHHHLHHLAPDHRFTVLTPDRAPDPGAGAVGTLPDGVELRSFAHDGSHLADYARRRVRALREDEPAHVGWVERPDLLAALDRELAANAPDVVHLFGRGTARLACRTGRIPAVHMPIDPWTLGYTNRRLPWWRRLADVGEAGQVLRHERRHYPVADAVVVVSPEDAAWLDEHVRGARVEVVPNGVDAGPAPGPPAEDPVLGFHGAMDAEANIAAARTLVERVLPAVRRAVGEARAVVIGRDPPAELRALARPGVEITGWVDDVRGRLATVAVYVAPMTSGSGMKNKVLEAMAAGLPVVATPEALHGIGAGGGVFEEADAAGVAARVVTLLGDPDARVAAGRQARTRVEEGFSWAESAARIAGVWRDAVARADRR